MNKAKAIGMGILFLVPGALAATLLTIILIATDYGPDPGTEVGTTLWGVWAICCWLYFKNSKFKWAGLVLLGFSLLGLLTKAI